MKQFHGRFDDAATETRYQLAARRYRLPFVRVYGVLFMLVALAYSIANPLLLEPGANARTAVLLGLALLIGGAYVAASFWDKYLEFPAIDFAALVALSLLVGKVNIVLFDFLMEQQAQLHTVAAINRLAVTAFAAVVLAGRPRLFAAWLGCDLLGWMGQVLSGDRHVPSVTYALLSYVSGAAVMVAINLAIGMTSRRAFALTEALEVERARNEALVHNMLPAAAVERIRDGRLVADAYADASVIFIDMVGFSSLAKRISPGHLVELLNAFFNHADRCAAAAGVEKVKTVGDAYLAIAGANQPSVNSADAALAFARAVLEGIPELRRVAGVEEVSLRVGIHSGPVVGGVIGATRMAYDFWGETVNMAARLEGAAAPGSIAISESTWLRTSERATFGPPLAVTLKGVGETLVFQSAAVGKPLAVLPDAA